MEFLERNKLIDELKARGFEELAESENFGWTFEHGNGFKLTFDANGKFRLSFPNNPDFFDVSTEAQIILDLVDQGMSEF